MNEIKERTFVYKDPLFVKCLDFQDRDNYALLHICAYEPGGPTLTIPDDDFEIEKDEDDRISLEAQEETPPSGKDFLSKDLFALISDNHLVICTSGLRFGGFRTYVRNMLTNFEGDRVANSFKFRKSADKDKLTHIREHQVKKITLDSHLYEQDAREIEDRIRALEVSS